MKAEQAIWGTVFALALLLNVPLAEAEDLIYDNGGINTIDWALPIGQSVQVWNDMFFDKPTTVNVVSGGSVFYNLYVYESSYANVSGGYVDSLKPYDSGKVTVSEGTVYLLIASGTSHSSISGGSLSGLYAYNASQVNFSGGTLIYNFLTFETSQATISGGSIGGKIYSGDSGMATRDSCIITFVGTDFAINGTPVGYGEYDTMGADWIHGTLTGTLADGGAINKEFYIYDDSKIVLAPIPTLPGDANNDGVVSADDYASVQANFGDTGTPGLPGDANLDGLVSADDYASVQSNFGATAGGIPVPDPATLSLLALGGLVMLRHRKY